MLLTSGGETAEVRLRTGCTTHGTAIVLGEAGINPRLVNKVHEGRPHIQDRIKNGEYTYIINTTEGRQAIEDPS